ncbi:50S ribosomal protein L23 [Mycoplasma sp. Mirounga ES2805-ORL]|uniref:50S ribosomal protein L23 n=1 Tax=Mycoplasma sp. Mirounga ES2805-ORL TaxID=754514 RepID=UPI00197C3873|nr:50S ribosomal protein L23 [Mycoplasma sp. Mirounga ES2805-ORL]QSF13961.1 50S ribosomal protein L23 [Mycoplasma sp. Mirounga ES2805-ORL]
MELTNIIKRPILTEKTNNLQQQNTYTFEVDWAANKFQIKNAIEFIFQVTVTNVNTLKVDKKFKRVGRFEGFENRYKKAIVTLKEGDVINYYPQDANVKADEAKKATKAKEQAKAEKDAAKEKEAKLAEKLAAKKAAKEKNNESEKKSTAKAEKPEVKKEAKKPATKKTSAPKAKSTATKKPAVKKEATKK